MCEFISWVEKDGVVLYLTSRDLKSSRGKALRDRIGPDICGHGAIREFYDLAPGQGTERECTDFSTPDNFPAQIVEDIKSGAFRGIGVSHDLLTPEARAEYNKVRNAALAEYNKVCNAAWAEFDKVCNAAWAEFDKVRNAAWAEYNKVCNAAWAECDKVRNRTFWALFSEADNRAEAWR